jgi:Arc/MetJ-type ribon-helix-helix transcriptional regulator
MKTLKVQVPDQVARELETLVRAGWFVNEGELARQALIDFVRHHRFQLQEKYQRDDIRWALSLKGAHS